MEECLFDDGLTGASIAFDRATGAVRLREEAKAAPGCKHLFFPGCSMVTYALPLVEARSTTKTPRRAGTIATCVFEIERSGS